MIPLVDVKAQYAPLIPELKERFAEVLESSPPSATPLLPGSAPHGGRVPVQQRAGEWLVAAIERVDRGRVVLIDYFGQSETTVMIPLAVYSLVVLVPGIVDGVRSVPPETLAAAQAMGFGPVRRYLQVQLPIAAPAIIAGLRVAVVSSLSLVSVGMLIGNQGALGNMLNDATTYHRPALAVNSVLTTALLGILADALLVRVRRLLTPWMPRKGASR